MKLSKFYPNVLNDFFVRSVVTNIDNIKKNCIFVNLDNLTNFDIPSSLKQHIFVNFKGGIIMKSLFAFLLSILSAVIPFSNGEFNPDANISISIII
mgnify:CR=1 FL=1